MNAIGCNHIVIMDNIIKSYFEDDYHGWRLSGKWDFLKFIGKQMNLHCCILVSEYATHKNVTY